MSGNPEVVAVFLDLGMDIEWKPPATSHAKQNTYLALSLSLMKLRVFELLLERGANVNEGE